MQITVSGKNLDVSASLREHIEKKLSKIASRFDNIVTANVTLSTDVRKHIVDVTLFGQGFDISASSDSEDMYRSINEVVDKLERQLVKNREKPLAARMKDVCKDGERVVPEVKVSAEAPKANAPGVAKTISYEAEVMTVTEAMKALEEKGNVFQVFFNEEVGRINVVYTTERGVCLIDPKIPE